MGTVIEHGRLEFGGEGFSLTWAAALRPKTAGLPCGDAYLARRLGKSVLLAVVDGSGSGSEAARAAIRCQCVLSETASVCLTTLFKEAHNVCRGTRGAALAITLIDPSSRRLNWAAVGEVDGLLLRGSDSRECERVSVIQKGGTLGYNLPAVISQSHEIMARDTIIMASDGIRQAFREQIPLGRTAEALATEILCTYGRDNDDALVLVAQFDCLS